METDNIYIERKTHKEYMFIWVVFIPAASFSTYYTYYQKSVTMFILSLWWIYISYSFYGEWKNGDDYIVMNKKNIEIKFNNKVNVYRWNQISYLQFKENYSLTTRIGTSLYINSNGYEASYSFDFNIKENEFKEYANCLSGRKIFKNNGFSSSSKLFNLISKYLNKKKGYT